jgi:trigger factor
MSIKIEKTENKNELKLEFTIEAKKFDEAILRVYGKSAKYFNIPGFRKGKAPFNIVERMYGDQIFYEDAFNELVPPIYEKEIEENKIEAVSKPHIDIVNMKKGEDLVFTAIVQTRPEVELGKYKGIEIKKIEYPVKDEDVQNEIKQMQDKNSRLVTVDDRALENGDTATIDFEGFVDGVAFEGGKAEGHELEIGSGAFIPGFEDQLVGMKIDEEKEIKVTFPKEYFSKDLAGKEATFKVKLHEIKKKELPELDDEFAKDVSEFDTLEELKNSIKEKIAKLDELISWFDSNDFDIEIAIEKFKEAEKLSNNIEKDLNDLKNEVNIIKQKFE